MIVKWDTSFKPKLKRIIHRKLDQVGIELTDRMRKKVVRPRRGNIGDFRQHLEGEPPRTGRTGDLGKTLFYQFVDDNTIQVGTPLVRGRVLELGMVIVGKGKMMAVPLSDDAQKHRDRGGSPRTFKPKGKNKKLVAIHTKGVILLVETIRGGKGGEGARMIIHYLLTNKVHIRKHPFILPSYIEMQGRIAEIFSTPEGQ